MAGGAWRGVLDRVVLVGALGYFVDIYDLLLFSLVRGPSLRDLGLSDPEVLGTGLALLNWQMGGLLVGGILWGVLGDVRGRRSVLFGSIALYSVANLANGFVQTVPQYAVLRFVAGIGLAGELGAAVTLVSEALPARLRGYGTMLVSSIGILGAAAGYAVAKTFDWRLAYTVGGILGLVLLAARIALAESGMFERMARSHRRRSLALFIGPGAGGRLLRLAKVTLVGVPLWCAIGLLVTLSPEIGRSLALTGPVDAAKAVLVAYVGASLGSLASGGLSQVLRSRRLALMLFMDFTAIVAGAFLFLQGANPTWYYLLSFLLGLGVGYWAVFVQVAAEQFGTDLRATVATAAPNLVRGAVLPLSAAYTALSPRLGLAGAAVLLMAITLALALVSAWRLAETHGVDLDFTEAGRGRARTADARPSP